MTDVPLSSHDVMPKAVSIITGTFNSGRYLDNYFRMLDAQTFTDWEALLVDDGSSDDTVERIRAKARRDPRYRLIQKTPEGLPSRSRARGLAEAAGRYVAFCDHDDFWAPQKLELQLHVLARHPDTAILHTDRFVWKTLESPATPFWFERPLAELPVTEQAPEQVIYRGLQIIFSSFIADKELVRSVGFHPEMRGVDDFYLFVRLAHLGRIRRIDLPLTYYYAHQGNLSHTSNIFVEGFYKVATTLQQDDVSSQAKRSVMAQAYRTEAVSLLAIDRVKALRLFVRSLRLYFIPSTLNRVAFLLATFFVPAPVQRTLFKQVKRIKFLFPTLRDLF